MNTPRFALSIAAAASIAAGAAHADGLHGRAGPSASTVGHAKALGPNGALRADLASLPGIGRESIDAGAASVGAVRSDRAAVFMDWALAGAARARNTVRQRACCD
jgi:hypothetical protein